VAAAVFEYGIESEDEGEDEEEDRDDGERWLWVVSEGSRAAYRDMDLFVAGVAEPDLADRMARMLRGRGAFRRFRDELARWPDLHDRWYLYSAERRRGRARAWLAAEGFTPALPAAVGAQKTT
jgi:hypothetical protein